MRPPPAFPGGPCETRAMTVQPHLPEPLAAWMGPFLAGLTRPTGRHALVLVAGAVLAPGRRTVAAMLRVVGLGQVPTFTNYHRVLNRNRWSGRAVARRLLHLLLATFAPEGPVVIGIDETIERRWGARIRARGIYRDPVRSSRGHFVKTSGLRWITVMLLAPVPWAGRVWALPLLAALAPSERFAREHGRRHKTLTDRARQLLLLVARWLPGRRLGAVADSSYAAIELLAAVPARPPAAPPAGPWRRPAAVHQRPPGAAPPPGCSPRPRRAGRAPAAGRGCRARVSRPRPSAWPTRRPAGGGSRSRAGTAGPSGGSSSSRARRFGITRASGSRSAGSGSAMSPANSSRRASCAPTRTPIRSTCCAGSCGAGRSR